MCQTEYNDYIDIEKYTKEKKKEIERQFVVWLKKERLIFNKE